MTYKYKLSRRLAIAWRHLIGATAVLVGCNPGSLSQGNTQADNLTAVVVHPSAMQLAPGAHEQFRAFARLLTGDSTPIGVNWTASAGTITPDGMYTAPSDPGAYVVDATHPDKLWLTSSAQVSVDAPTLELIISPEHVAMQPQDSIEFSAVVVSSAGDTVPMDITFSSTAGSVEKKGKALGHFKPNGSRGKHKVVADADSAGLSDTAIVEIQDTLVATVVVIPSSLSLDQGQGYTLEAELRDSAGNPLSGRDVRWSSAVPQSVSVDSAGTITALSSGMAVVTAESEGVTGSTQVSVNAAAVASVEVTPGTLSLLEGESQQLVATVRDVAGNVLTGRAVTWVSADPGTATVDGAGVVVAVTEGSTSISATSEGTSSSAGIAVSRVPVASVVLSPSADTLAEGETLQLTATPLDSAGRTLYNRSVSWSSSSSVVASVSSSGVVTASAAGTATITASSEGKSATASITVTRVPVASVNITGGSGSVPVGEIMQLQAETRDAAGNLLSNRAVTWSSSNPAIATVSSGLVVGVAIGSVTVTATSEGQQGTANVTVTPPPTPATPIFDEDFSSYTSTPDLMVNDNDPWSYTSIGPGGDIELDQSAGFGGSSQSMRYDYPANNACSNYTVGRQFLNLKAPYDTLKNFWVEYVIKFSPNWRTDLPGCGGFPDHKTIEIFPQPTGQRWEVKIGAGGYGFQQSSPEHAAGNNEATVNRLPPYDATRFWDGTWKIVRVQVANLGSGQANGVWRIWFDDGNGMRLVHEETSLLYELSAVGIRNMWIGQNRNEGQDQAMSWSVGRIRVYSEDPRW